MANEGKMVVFPVKLTIPRISNPKFDLGRQVELTHRLNGTQKKKKSKKDGLKVDAA